MSNFTRFFCVALLAVSVVSCKKESSEPNTNAGDLQGTWDFVSMTVSSESTVSYTISGSETKSVTETDYTTTNNSGTVTIDASNMASSNLAYSVSTVASAKTYVDGSLLNETEFPFNFSAPSSSGSAAYKVVSADSLYFESGSTIFANGVTQASEPSGAKYRIEGNQLYITQNVKQSTSQTEGGIIIKQEVEAVAEIKLQKQ